MAAPHRAETKPPELSSTPRDARLFPAVPLPSRWRVRAVDRTTGFRAPSGDELVLEHRPARLHGDRESLVGFMAFVSSVLIVFGLWRIGLGALVATGVVYLLPRNPAPEGEPTVLTVSSRGQVSLRCPGRPEAVLARLNAIDRRPLDHESALSFVVLTDGANQIVLGGAEPPRVVDELTRVIAAHAGLGLVRDGARGIAARPLVAQREGGA